MHNISIVFKKFMDVYQKEKKIVCCECYIAAFNLIGTNHKIESGHIKHKEYAKNNRKYLSWIELKDGYTFFNYSCR